MSRFFPLQSDYEPQGDQAQAIAKLVKSVEAGNRHQTLLGVTGSGKTFTMANVISQVGKPALILSHNKTLAAQLYSEFKNFFPESAVEYFVSYFDYYQPEAYIPRTDTFIEKDSAVNDEIERLRLSCMGALLTRKDVIVVASVSCIYGLGSPEDYANMMLPVKVGETMTRESMLVRLVDMLYERNDIIDNRPTQLAFIPIGGKRRQEINVQAAAAKLQRPLRTFNSDSARRNVLSDAMPPFFLLLTPPSPWWLRRPLRSVQPTTAARDWRCRSCCSSRR